MHRQERKRSYRSQRLQCNLPRPEDWNVLRLIGYSEAAYRSDCNWSRMIFCTNGLKFPATQVLGQPFAARGQIHDESCAPRHDGQGTTITLDWLDLQLASKH